MTLSYLNYPIEDGFIDHWLVAGPVAIAVDDLERFQGPDFKLQIARHFYVDDHEIDHQPHVQYKFQMSGQELRWRYYRCEDDHFVDLTAFYHTCHYLRAWAYAQIYAPEAGQATLALTTNGPADVWINGEHVHRQEHFHHQIPHTVAFSTTLQQGQNEVLVRMEEVAVRECPYAMALRIVESPSEPLAVYLPTELEAIARWQNFERLFEQAYVDREVYGRDEQVTIRWPENMRLRLPITVRIQTPDGRIYAEAYPTVEGGSAVKTVYGVEVPPGPYQAILMPPLQEYYTTPLRIQRTLNFHVMRTPYSAAPEAPFSERRIEALDHASTRDGELFAEIANMALGRWKRVEQEPIRAQIERINARADCSDFYMVGLLGMMHRYMNHEEFPEDLKEPLTECVLNFKYWMDEPGEDAMCYWSENHQILFHTCEILAGQLFPDRIFTNAGQTGQWHREKGERLALSWLRKRGMGGFQEWDSNCYFEEDVLALAHLADLAENPVVRQQASNVLDKLLFTMAVNSFKGTFGSTHGRTYSPMIKDGRLEPTSGIGRLLWGTGCYNHRILGVVSLACAQNYTLPAAIRGIALDLPEEMWSRERHAGTFEEWCDRQTGEWEVNKVTYKTPDYMLCSAQDYHPGERGYQQHIWQATLSHDAVVFVTHPPCVSEEGSHRPNFWHGNVVLPRVAQWKDVLIAIHYLPPDDWMGFTHAYFPTFAFDEHVVRNGWAFARKGDGYLALTAAKGIRMITRGPGAYRELRSYGDKNVWFCHMGRAAQDGSFQEFQEKILALDIQFGELSVKAQTLHHGPVTFGWDEPLVVDGREQPLSGFPHYETPYCTVDWPSPRMEIRFRGHGVALEFEPQVA